MAKTSVSLKEEAKARLDSYKAWLAFQKRPSKVTLEDAISHLLDIADEREKWSK